MKTLIAMVLVIATFSTSFPAFADEPAKPAGGGRVKCISADKELFKECLAAARTLLTAKPAATPAVTATTPMPEAGTLTWVWPVIIGTAIVGGGLAIFFATRKPEVRVHYDAPAGQ